ncbi:MAG: right-handed parallel beta-helix repeat-containing protein [bacterium]|nr:right-handed parallel beta-helix repeat-containing protein [bacterium]
MARTQSLLLFFLCCVTGAWAQTPVVGPVSGTWTLAGSPYRVLSSGVTVDAPAGLTIEAGVVVEFETGASLIATGDVRAEGTAGNEVILRGTSQPGSAGDWNGVVLESGTHEFVSTRFSDASTAVDSGSGGDVDLTLQDCTFSGSSMGLFHSGGGALFVADSSFSNVGAGIGLGSGLGPNVTIRDNAFSDCNEAMLMNAAASPSLGGNTASGCTVNGTRVFSSGSITGAAIWAADGMPRVVTDERVTIASGAGLTIEAGAVVKFQDGFDVAGLSVEGSLNIDGTPGNPVVLTSLLDDSVSGDTNGDGAASSPSVGDWAGVENASGSASLTSTHVGWANTGIDSGSGGGADLTVEDCTFTDASMGLFHGDAGSLSVTGSSFSNVGAGIGLGSGLGPNVTIQDNAFSDCNEAMLMGAAASPVLGGNRAAGCTLNGVRVFDTGPITGSVTWDDDGLPRVVEDATIHVAGSGSLTLEAGAVVKLLNGLGGAELNVAGSLVINGTWARPVVFTSLLDDAVLGDTNADDDATSPAPGDWGRIDVSAGTATIDGVVATWAAAGVAGTSGTTLEIRSSRFQHCWTGLEVLGADGFLHDSVVTENLTGVTIDASTDFVLGDVGDPDPVRHGLNDLFCNGNADVQYNGPGILAAQNNWWGEDPPDASEIVVFGGGAVDTSGYRLGPIHDLVGIGLERPSESEIALGWPTVTTCTAYRAQRSLDVQFTDIDLDMLLPPGSTGFTDIANPGEQLVFYRVLPE